MQYSAVYCEEGIDAFKYSIAQHSMAQHSKVVQQQIQPRLEWDSGRRIMQQVDAPDNGRSGL